jgi:polyhydroxyalkanoate synthesis regulator phasin
MCGRLRPQMAARRTTPKDVPDALREAVERTVQATVGSAQQTRDRAQGAVDELVDAAVSRSRAARVAMEDRLPATHEDVKELKAELRRISRRLDAIEERLPASRSRTGSGSAAPGGTGRP